MSQSIHLSFSSSFTNRSLLKPTSHLGISVTPPKPFNFTPSCISSDPKSDDSPPSKLISLLKAIPDWSDGIKERRMQQKRSLYTHENWVRHRSSLRHLRHVSTSLSSRVILSLIPPVSFFTSVAILIAGYNTLVDLDLLPSFCPVLRASPLPYQLTASALALLLVFRTEASYSRFEEGRKAWVKVINGSNDLARLVVVSSKDDDDDDEMMIRDTVLRYIAAFPIALKCYVMYGSDIAGDLEDLVDADDLELILESKHRPRCVLQFISQSLQMLQLDSTKSDMLETKMLQLQEGIGVCEQLMGIPIPLSYTRLTSRFLVLWHLTLPIILWDDCHWNVVPATFISAASLFCIEEVGVLIEEPFSMLALDELCAMVLSNIEEAVESKKVIRNRIIAKKRVHEIKHSSNGWHKP